MNATPKRALIAALMWLLTGFFSWATVILAAAPLKALRIAQGAILFWLASSCVAAALWFAAGPLPAIGFLAVCMLIGLDHELEQWGVPSGASAAAALFGLTAFLGTAFGLYLRTQRARATEVIESVLQPGLLKLKELYPQAAESIDLNQTMAQIPSAVVVLGLLSLALGKVTYGTWLRMLGGSRREWKASQRQQLSFRVWEPLIFVLMLALLAAFVEHPYGWLKLLGLNVVNVLAVLYFFQGLAVSFFAMDWLRFGPIARIAFGFLLMFQFAIVVALVGVADYWLDLRRKMAARSARQNKTVNRISDEEL